tara:strand:+ start:1355 stop:1546 length:192 start_codon:yes stop_codon:yes gene_type:complete
MKVIAYQIRESEDMLIVDTFSLTVERQTPEGTILWREMFLDKKVMVEYVEQFVKDGVIYGAIM